MIDHVGLAVSDIERSRAFYEAALAPLGITLLVSVGPEKSGGGAHLGFGKGRKPFFWISDKGRVGQGTHVAFVVEERSVVDAFYTAALAAGGKDNGAPGLRPHYHPNYYGAFVFDPDGVNVEAVCHRAPG